MPDSDTAPLIAASLAEWAIGVRMDDELGVAERARRMLLDVIGVSVAGAQSSVARRVRERLSLHSPGSDVVIGTPQRLARPAAVFANGVAAHSLELDDGYTRGSVHPSTVVAPAVLAATAGVGGSIDDLVRSFVIGAEVTCRIAEAGHPQTYWRGFHNTSLAGVIGAAAGCASALDLDAESTVHAIGLACSHAGGTFEFAEDGADSKRLHPGIAARDAWQCAEFASAGITAPSRALEGRRGYFLAFAGAIANVEQRVLAGLGDVWRVHDVYTKPHACCRALHASIDALLQIRDEENVRWDGIERITITTYRKAAEYCRTEITTLLDAQMSLPLVAVVALRRGSVGLADLEWMVQAGGFEKDLQKVTVQTSTEFDELYPPLRPNHVSVETIGGARHERYVDQPFGEPGNEMTADALQTKFRGLAEPVLGVQAAAEIETLLSDGRQSVGRLLDRASLSTEKS